MNIAEVIAEVRKRIAGLVACEIKHMGAQGGYFLCKWKGSLRCMFFQMPNAYIAAMAGKTPEMWVANSIAHDLQHE
ncbi:MAG TPA: hypothetical protein PLL72_26115 [Burkholderiaceae bacterium]|nr:hypothetical protein [Burkholderiaceae bacterium]